MVLAAAEGVSQLDDRSVERRDAPRGFTAEQWKTFERDGLVVIPDAIEPAAVAAYLAAAEETAARYPDFRPGHTWRLDNLVREHDAFRDLIDHDRHAGFGYDLYGDHLTLSQSDLFIRPRASIINHWHIDGPRAVPYRAFSELPLKLRVGYWLTDVTDADMGNFVYLPGSHKADYTTEHVGLAEVEGQKTLLCKAGTMTIAHASMWHRVNANRSDRTRATIFLSYTPSWVTGYYKQDPAWLASLTREQRIIMRGYEDLEDYTRPQADDLPLFRDPSLRLGQSEEELHKVRRFTRYERHLREAV